jgi:hypothetical protein
MKFSYYPIGKQHPLFLPCFSPENAEKLAK